MDLKRSLSLWIPILGLLLFLTWLVLYSNDTQSGSGEQQGTQALLGLPDGGDFQVDTADGEVSLQDFKSNVVLLYFGYTSCPDSCRISLSKISLALQNLSQKERSQVKTVFISLDPARDSVEKLKEYVQYFHGSFIGATTKENKLNKILKQYGVVSHKVGASSGKSYLINHSTHVYVIGKGGVLKKVLLHGMSSMDMATVIRTHLKAE